MIDPLDLRRTDVYLRDRWEKTVGVLKSKASDLDPLFYEILARYGEDHRYYHTTEHIRHCFETLDKYYPDLANGALEMALWYHDIVYDTHRNDNEAMSALLAYNRCHDFVQATDVFCHHVQSLVELTRHSQFERTFGEIEAILLDVDLYILSTHHETFDSYEEDIRAEYKWVPDEEFRQGRIAVLKGFLARSKIYHSIAIRHLEDDARENLEHSLKRLETRS